MISDRYLFPQNILKRYIYINNIISWFERLGSGSELELSLAADQLGLQQSMFWGKMLNSVRWQYCVVGFSNQ